MEAKDYSIMHCKDGNLYINRNQLSEFRSSDSKCFSKEDLKSIESWIKQNNEYTRTDAFIEKAAKFLDDNLYTYDNSSGRGLWTEVIADTGFNTVEEFIENFRKYMKGE